MGIKISQLERNLSAGTTIPSPDATSDGEAVNLEEVDYVEEKVRSAKSRKMATSIHGKT